MISLALAVALIVVALGQLNQGSTTCRPAKGTLPTVNKMTGYEHLALSPNTRRAFERYSL
ncbi:hypothetical protein [Pseudomonas sp. KCJK8670]|uniref:hypothetical protein n=1 Tax=Pseudomonas sp. KCJK8670 TaxID=3344558 RepID=UPI0039061CB4